MDEALRRQVVQRTGGSWAHHGEWIAAIYGFVVHGTGADARPVRYQLGYDAQDAVEDFFRGGQANVLHWLGHDLLQLERGAIQPPRGKVTHLCPNLDAVRILRQSGLDGQIVWHHPKHRLEATLDPAETPTVACYVPPTRRQFFRYDLMKEVERALAPEWAFRWIEPTVDELNAQVIDMVEVMQHSTLLLRAPERDFFSYMAAEFVMAGRRVLNTEVLPFQDQVKPTLKSITETIREVGSKPPDRAAALFYRTYTAMSCLARAIEEAMR